VSAVVRFLADLPRFVFFTGKGGVGKTSLACATAVHLADAGRRVLLVSTDPASNVGQVFGVTIGALVTPVPGVDGLAAIEIDPQQAAQAYRERIVGPVRDLLPAAEIASITEQLSGSCTTEVASFNEFTALLADDHAIAAYDHVVFDTAPTGHTIRLLQLPGEWTEFLDAGKGDASCLGPMAGLDRARSTYATALARLADPAWTRLVLVARAQASSLAEAARTATELAQIGITDQHLVVNGVLPPDVSGDRLAAAIHQRESRALADLPPALAGMPCTHVPLRADTIVGVAAVRRLLADDAVLSDDAEQSRAAGGGAGVPDLGLPGLEVPRPVLPGLDRLVEDLARQDHGLVMCMGKGGVGKTTVAAAIAVALADRGHAVHLTTTDPAGHLDEALGTDSSDAQVLAGADGTGDGGVQVGGGARITVSRIDPRAATAAYREKVLATKGASLDEAGRARLAEDLLSPCTEEVAVFGQFSHLVHEARRQFVVMDTAPTGHTLLLMDATGSYHRDVVRNLGGSDSEGGGVSGGGADGESGGGSGGRSGGRTAYTTPLMRLRDPDLTRVVIVTLPDTTPVLEAEALQADLERADIHPWAWVVNSSLAAAKPTSSLLAHRAAAESPHLARVGSLAPRTAVIPLLADEPVGVERLRSLVPQSKSKDAPVTDAEKTKPSVLFVCVHNAGRSQMGAAYTTHLSGGAVEVRSAGSAPAETINPAVREAMLEEGIDISAEKPKILTTEAVQASDVVITMGCGDTCPYFPGKRYLDWVLEDPAGQGVASVRPIRDEIKRRVLGLLGELGVEPVELGR
jgi:arsenite-transporting ATPase